MVKIIYKMPVETTKNTVKRIKRHRKRETKSKIVPVYPPAPGMLGECTGEGRRTAGKETEGQGGGPRERQREREREKRETERERESAREGEGEKKREQERSTTR